MHDTSRWNFAGSHHGPKLHDLNWTMQEDEQKPGGGIRMRRES
jgi:hypothetical protein